MTKFYTLEYAHKCKDELKRERNIVGIVIAILICAAGVIIALRNPVNHTPALVAICFTWICGVWLLMFHIMAIMMPLKRDVAFCNVMISSNKKRLDGEVVTCAEKITMRRMPCYSLKILAVDKKEERVLEVYLDRRLISEPLKEGSRVRLLVAQHFVFALEMGGTKDD